MKAQFKYSILSGMYGRLPVFAVIIVMMLVFIVFGALNILPDPAYITGISLGGVAIGVMCMANIWSDVRICGRMFGSSGATLYALTPVPRWKTLLASVLTITVADIVTLTCVIFGEAWLSLSYAMRNAGGVSSIFNYNGGWLPVYFVLCYLLLLLIILFGVAMKKSAFFKLPASGLLGFLASCVSLYAVSLLYFVLAPFGWVERYKIFFTVHLSYGSVPAGIAMIALTLLEAAGLFALTSKLLESKINL